MKGRRSINSPHIQHTKAESLDEAIDILMRRAFLRRVKAHRAARLKPFKPSLKQELHYDKFARDQFVTLSDRTKLIPKIAKQRTKNEEVVWSKVLVLEKWQTKSFTVRDLAKMAKVNTCQIKYWIWGPEWKPQDWLCCQRWNLSLGREQYTSNHRSEYCKTCGIHWKERFNITD